MKKTLLVKTWKLFRWQILVLFWIGYIEQEISPPKIAPVGFPSEIVRLEIFCNEECTILNTIHASGVVFKRVLECQIRNSFLVLSQNKRCYNLETFKCKHKKLGTQSETSLLINCGKLFSLPSKKWGSSWPESSSGITQICYQKITIISIIRFYWSNNQSELAS